MASPRIPEYLGDLSKEIIKDVYEHPIEYTNNKYSKETLGAINTRIECIQMLTAYLKKCMPKKYRYIIHPAIYRWITTQRLIDRESTDPVLPVINRPNQGFIIWLNAHDSGNINAVDIDREMRNICAHCVSNIKLNNNFPLASSISIVNKQTYNEIRSPYCPALQIDHAKYKKLFKIYSKDMKSATQDSDGFKLSLWRMLIRYEPLMSAGYHAALPREVFDVLKSDLNVDCELYASPLNSYLPRYCSLFPDTDMVFGSLGNVLYKDLRSTLFAHGGSFEVNPPFTEEHLAVTTNIILEMLDTVKYPLRFVVIYPLWKDLWTYDALITSKYNVLQHLPEKTIVLGSGLHKYQRGDQHKHAELYVSRCITMLFILQNDLNTDISTDTIDKITTSFTINE